MKNLKFFCIVIMVVMVQVSAFSQGISINSDGTPPDNSAMLDIKSPATPGLQMGVLFPQVNLANAFNGGAATHLFGVNTNSAFNAGSRFNTGLGLYRFDGTRWNRLLESTDSSLFWGTRGNAIVSGDFLGTTNNQALVIRTNNIDRINIPTNPNAYINITSLKGVRAPSGIIEDAIYSIGSINYGLTGNSALEFAALRFGASGFLKGVNGVGVVIDASGGGDLTPREALDVWGNIYPRSRLVYSAYNTLSNATAHNDKTGKVERYWSGSFPNLGSSTAIFQESGVNGIQFRVTKAVGGIYTIDASVQGSWAGDYSQDGNVRTLVSGAPWGAWVAVTPGFSGANSSYEFTLTRRTNTGANDASPVYLIRAIINSDGDNIKIIIEAWYKQ